MKKMRRMVIDGTSRPTYRVEIPCSAKAAVSCAAQELCSSGR